MAIGDWELVGRLALAGGLGALVGFEREVRHQQAGVRTHALVALGACLFTIAGAYGFSDLERGPNVDPARVAAQVATGIGFIGAGAILRSGFTVRGLTTAATLWLVAALGMAAGAGAYAAVVAGFAIVLLALVGLRIAKGPLLERFTSPRRVVVVEFERGYGTLKPILDRLEATRGRLGRLSLEEGDGGRRRALIEVTGAETADLDPALREIATLDEVVEVHLEEGSVLGPVTAGRGG